MSQSTRLIATKVCPFAILLSVIGCLGAETVRIHVENGRSGKTITDEQIQVWVNARTGTALNLIPGRDGVAVLEAPAGSSIEIESNYYKDCRPFEKGAPRPKYSIDEIKHVGVVARNACGKLNSEAKRGELLFFVRPIHRWEGMKR